MKIEGIKIQVLQDGGDFYIPGTKTPLWRFQHFIFDGDNSGATQARRAFEAYCKQQGFEPRFI